MWRRSSWGKDTPDIYSRWYNLERSSQRQEYVSSSAGDVIYKGCKRCRWLTSTCIDIMYRKPLSMCSKEVNMYARKVTATAHDFRNIEATRFM